MVNAPRAIARPLSADARVGARRLSASIHSLPSLRDRRLIFQRTKLSDSALSDHQGGHRPNACYVMQADLGKGEQLIMNKQSMHPAKTSLGVAAALSLMLGAGAVQAAAMFQGSAEVMTSVSNNPSGMPISLNANFFLVDQSSTTLTGATVSTTTGASPLLDPTQVILTEPLDTAALTVDVSGSADATGNDDYAEATASALGVTGILLDNSSGATPADFALSVDWLYSAEVAADLPDESAGLALALLVNIVDETAGQDIDEFAIFDVFFLTDTSALSGDDSGLRSVNGTVPVGDIYNVGLRLQVLNGFADSNPQEAPLPAPVLLLVFGLPPLLALKRRRAH